MKRLLAALAVFAGPLVFAATPQQTKEVDALFAKFDKTTPGCAVGVEQGGKRVLTKAYGMADLEFGMPITPETIFEAGSVSKQFTAAAIAVLASQGKLSLDDDVHKFLKDLPDYGTPITLRQMLNHTSGLREWSDIVELQGWPRTTRAISQDYAAQAIFRQKSLNFTPGAEYLYSNSNYVLLALVVERASGMSLEKFTRDNLFGPAGMTHTAWRGDFTRIVPGRAQAYGKGEDGAWHLDMPFENVIGHAGLLTTVGDLLRWNEALTHPPESFKGWVPRMTEGGVTNDGKPVNYALALGLGPINGDRAISHTGSTAGYRAFLGRFPEQGLSIVTLCNSATVTNGPQAAKLEAIFSTTAKPQPEPAPKEMPATEWRPAIGQLTVYAGRYASAEVRGSFDVKIQEGALKLISPSGRTIVLRPLTEGHFIGTDNDWRVDFDPKGLALTGDRTRNIRFDKVDKVP